MKKEQKPWTDKNGKTLSKTKLRSISGKWKKRVWEEYASSLEVPQNELIFKKPINYERSLSKDNFFVSAPKRRRMPRFRKQMNSLMKGLSNNQQMVLKMIFWEDKRLNEVASRMKVSEVAVLRIRDRALKQLRKKFIDIAVEIYKEEKNLPYLEKMPTGESKEALLREQLLSACSQWCPKVWEQCLSNLDENKGGEIIRETA